MKRSLVWPIGIEYAARVCRNTPKKARHVGKLFCARRQDDEHATFASVDSSARLYPRSAFLGLGESDCVLHCFMSTGTTRALRRAPRDAGASSYAFPSSAHSPNPLLDDDDILLHLIPFVIPEGYLYVAGVTKCWQEAWGMHPKITSIDNAVESASRLEWAKGQQGWSWDATVCRRSAAGGHLGALRYARSQGCPWNEQTCSEAAAAGHLSILRWARANGCPWDASTCAAAASRGHLDMLRWARRQGCPWDKTTCTEAAGAGELEVLQWARANGCEWNADTCKHAARSGHLDVLRWARSQGCPWDTTTCSWAAGGGYLDVLRWARENGCPWDKTICSAAAREGELEILQWARSQVSYILILWYSVGYLAHHCF